MLKMGYVVFLITTIFTPCFAGNSTDTLSKEKKEIIRSTLYSLIEAEQESERRQKEQKKKQIEWRDSMKRLALAAITQEEGEDFEETEELNQKETTENSKESKKSKEEEKSSKWKMVLNPKNNSYVQTLFENDENLQEWVKGSSELLFNVIRSNNLEMLEFFVEKGAIINAARESTLFSPLHFSIISKNKLEIIKFFLDHPEIDLRQTSVWGDNIFHMVFLGGIGKEARTNKISVLSLLFQEEYFLKISDLLNTPNNHKETALDLAWKDSPPRPYTKYSDPLTSNGSFYDIDFGITYPHTINLYEMNASSARVIEMLKEKEALLFKDLPESKKPPKQQMEGDVCATEFRKLTTSEYRNHLESVRRK